MEIAEFAKGKIIANHLEALDHCPVTRKELRAAIKIRNWEHKLYVPNDGETVSLGIV